MSTKSIGIFGGTFDPVHNGHITVATELLDTLALDEMRLLPCGRPPHRDTPRGAARQRLDMLQLATKNSPLVIDGRELQNDTPSYTIDSLEAIRKETGPNTSLLFCLGTDAFNNFDQWRRWRDITGVSHIVVAQRPDTPMTPSAELKQWMETKLIQDKKGLKAHTCGSIYLAQVSQIPVSSTAVRDALYRGEVPTGSLPDAVAGYIEQNNFYTPDNHS